MKKIFCIFIIFCSCFLGGCFNYNDIDKVIFVTSIIIDVDTNGNPILYVESFKPERTLNASAGSSQRILFKGSRKTLFETIRDINMSSSYKLNYTQLRGIIFTEKAAESNLYDYIDYFERDQESVIRSNLLVLKGDPDTFIKTVLKEQEYIGIFINDLIKNIPASSRAIVNSLNGFLNEIYSRQSISIIPMIELKLDQPEPKIQLTDGAIIENYKMVDTLRLGDELGYNFLTDNIKSGSLEVTNPSSSNNYVSLEILRSKTKCSIYMDGKNIIVRKKINLKATVAEAQNRINLNHDTIEKLEQEAEKNIKDACNDVFEKYKLKKLDIFNIGEDFQRKYPKSNIDNPIEQSQLQLDVNVNVEGSSDKTNFRS
ncbi:MAG: Ger(x)C family spore germination protein [Clostridium tyrobutyricum]|jgi:Ger(x)C family germination protein|uniref:Ger(x)C family spore germination protein n=1 Tax=Clostridium tyrobutyricum TaxID=1519 RepID=UPI00242B645E|nr:Ger(x)C family spore germination protein [Clostridium tyrobutyricum]MCH4199081.1 Ger(x)C family spore germination protein [Clostridium tyrobutyricum]MCH4236769.1 Ger(x)C family spore germination protein [Clostridium tyrobutyricum]MCH4258526.1 Ger(x)C family spore germination protein [Clostridium tyrobutyricum]MCI1239276.1 Ger(x)C family spore germination protein [Clostridium tyrobutyricum]MCI1652859.1 Ger(x)C family spore germination protein [Clostridium tyrobutyricum]